MPNAYETKTCYSPEELPRLMGCHCFRNYQHIISVLKDGTLLKSGEFPLSLGSYATIPKAPRGKPIDHLPLKYLDIVHVDIAFEDCISIGGFKYALIFVDHTTCNNWTSGLKLLGHNNIQAEFLSFGAKLGYLQDSSVAIAMKSFLAVPSNLSFIKSTLPLPPALRDVNHPMALLNCIGKSWYTCPGHISRRSKRLVRSGTTP
jgi:hypothetical protein